MKDITKKLISLLKEGYCTPQISRIAKKIKEPSATIHYNLKKMEREGTIKKYKAVFDYKQIEEGYCSYSLINVATEDYGNPEKIAQQLATHPQVESVDICTGDYELLIKLRTKDVDEYYALTKILVTRYKFAKMVSITSLKQIKTEFV